MMPKTVPEPPDDGAVAPIVAARRCRDHDAARDWPRCACSSEARRSFDALALHAVPDRCNSITAGATNSRPATPAIAERLHASVRCRAEESLAQARRAGALAAISSRVWRAILSRSRRRKRKAS